MILPGVFQSCDSCLSVMFSPHYPAPFFIEEQLQVMLCLLFISFLISEILHRQPSSNTCKNKNIIKDEKLEM